MVSSRVTNSQMSLNSSYSGQKNQSGCAMMRGQQAQGLLVACSERPGSSTRDFSGGGCLSFGAHGFVLYSQGSVALRWLWAMGNFADFWTSSPKKSYHLPVTFSMTRRVVKTWVCGLTDMHLDNYEIQEIGTNFNVLCGHNDYACITYRRQKFALSQT